MRLVAGLLLVPTILLTFALAGAAGSIQRAERIARLINSPDSQLRAVIVGFAPRTNGGMNESGVEIHDHNNRAIATKDFTSPDGNDGWLVDMRFATWTPDSQFFVFNVSSSGGHQPWQSPVWFFSKAQRRFQKLSELINDRPVLSDDAANFQIVPPHSVKIRTWKNPHVPVQSEAAEIALVVDLATGSQGQ